MRVELEPALSAARSLPPDELPRLLGDLEEIRTTALARLSSTQIHRSTDELLDVEHAAERLGVSTDYLYRHHAQFAFTRRMGRKLLFSSSGIGDYMRRRK